ncbi:MAG: sugar kinase [Moritella sp.]|uniref:sugar kinase n=1 Tax=Moritella sp. TaxID=78556 RepID=UPI0029ACE91D|nr:sugar kinase [Moritella sp.]MDX2321977.1 sugar kinase [Moritella sp.]
MKKHKKIAIIGECMIELSGKPFESQQQNFGGDSLNTAVYLSRLQPSVSVQYMTGLGVDQYSQSMLSAWRNEGIDTSLVTLDETKIPGLYAIAIDATGERTFSYWRNDSAARYMCEHAQFELNMASLVDADLIYLSGISLAILPDSSKLKLLASLATLKQAGVKIAVDSNYRPRLWQSPAHAQQWLDKLYQLSDIALVTGDDEDLLLGTQNTEATVIAKRLHNFGIEQVVVKLGSAGAMWSHAGQQGTVTTNKIELVVDTTAAGDSFNAAYLAAWCAEQSMADCCDWGNGLAGQVIQYKGAVIPTEFMQHLITRMRIENDK